jgi:hypothetical protein
VMAELPDAGWSGWEPVSCVVWYSTSWPTSEHLQLEVRVASVAPAQRPF